MAEDTALQSLIASFVRKHGPRKKPKGEETSLIARLLKRAAFMPAVMLRRNNVGTLKDRNGRYVTYGLGIGSSDLIGYRSRVITAADVGTRVAVFCAVEVKSERGRVSEAQAAFIERVREAGGIGGVVKSIDDLEALL